MSDKKRKPRKGISARGMQRPIVARLTLLGAATWTPDLAGEVCQWLKDEATAIRRQRTLYAKRFVARRYA